MTKIEMIGYPYFSRFCPRCGSYEIDSRSRTGEGKCESCGAHWIAIQGEDDYEE